MKTDSTKIYQLVVGYGSNLKADDQKKNLTGIEKFLTEAGVKANFTAWGEKKLAYRIEGNDTAWYWLADIKVPEDNKFKWPEFRTFLNRDKQVIRYLILQKE